MSLIDSLIEDGWLKSERIIDAFREIKRKDFLPSDLKDSAQANQALPIGHHQTISQPLVVAFMLEKLTPKPGDKILDVGSGSGWTTALLAQIVGKEASPAGRQGKVIGVELVPELKEFGEKNTSKYNFIDKGIATFICGDGRKGYKEEAPYDKILCSAAVQGEIPKAWKEQLKQGGRIVTPIKSSIFLLIKSSEEELERKEFPGFAFVPLIEK